MYETGYMTFLYKVGSTPFMPGISRAGLSSQAQAIMGSSAAMPKKSVGGIPSAAMSASTCESATSFESGSTRGK